MKIYLLLFLLLIGCSKEDHFKSYVIKKGNHGSIGIKPCVYPSLKFEAIFDNSAIYDIGSDQSDINKLYGFSDEDHRKNSARFGWRWYNDSIQIFAYTHIDSKFYFKHITSTMPGNVIDCSLVAGTQYYFTCNGVSVIMDRGKNSSIHYYLFPYFGGNQVAPHKILIKIKDK